MQDSDKAVNPAVPGPAREPIYSEADIIARARRSAVDVDAGSSSRGCALQPVGRGVERAAVEGRLAPERQPQRRVDRGHYIHVPQRPDLLGARLDARSEGGDP